MSNIVNTHSQNISIAHPMYVDAYPNTGTSGHYIMWNFGFTTTSAPILDVIFPTGGTRQSTTETEFDIPTVSSAANKVQILTH